MDHENAKDQAVDPRLGEVELEIPDLIKTVMLLVPLGEIVCLHSPAASQVWVWPEPFGSSAPKRSGGVLGPGVERYSPLKRPRCEEKKPEHDQQNIRPSIAAPNA